jgi:hypothetical protein
LTPRPEEAAPVAEAAEVAEAVEALARKQAHAPPHSPRNTKSQRNPELKAGTTGRPFKKHLLLSIDGDKALTMPDRTKEAQSRTSIGIGKGPM